MKDFKKTIRLGTIKEYPNIRADIFAKIEFQNGKLSISGVIGPKHNGDCIGSCGQFIMSFKEYDNRGHQTIGDIEAAPGWNFDSVKRFFDVWDRWHLNDMKAGSAAQEEWLRRYPIPQEEYAYPKNHYEVASAKLAAAGLNPDPDGYKYGSAWKREEVPAEVIEFLQSLPDTNRKPAWV